MRTTLVATFVLAFLPWSAAQAVTRWATPFVSIGTGDEVICSVTNLDKKPLSVEVNVVNSVGADITLGGSGSGCVGPLQPNWTCTNEGPTSASGWCFAVTDSSKVRVVLEVTQFAPSGPPPPRLVVPATKQ